MKKCFTIIAILIVTLSCNSSQHINASAIGLVNLENYAAKNNTSLPNTFNYMVLTNQTDFDATFGIATAGNINITYPSFSGQTVVACIAQPSTNKITIRFERAEVAGKELKVYCTTSSNGEQLKQAATPAGVATVPKVLSINKVVFYANGEKVTTRTVDFENVQIKGTDVVKKNNTDIEKPVVLKRTMRRPAVI